MSRKVLISFLGTTNYVSCNYYYKDLQNKVDNVRFVQEATLKILCSDFSEQDEVLIFATNDAKDKNWVDNGQPPVVVKSEEEKIGLKTRLENLQKEGFKGKIYPNPIEIDEGFSEKEVWNIFDKIYEKLQTNDEVYLDITHSFRFMPMLAMVLLNYAKLLKQITVKSITYGAFEGLGPAFAVREIKREMRNARIVEIESFSDLQNWTTATSQFIKYGLSSDLKSITQNNYKEFTDSLNNVTDSINTNRGKRIYKGKIFEELEKSIQKLDSVYPPPLKNIINEISNKIKDFEKSKSWKNGLSAAQWCVEHNMTQQGITILEELIITYISEKVFKKEKDIYNAYKRGLVSQCFYVKERNTNKSEWKPDLQEEKNQKYIESIFSLLTEEMVSLKGNLSKLRNDINHSGYTNDQNPDLFAQGLKDSLKIAQSILK